MWGVPKAADLSSMGCTHSSTRCTECTQQRVCPRQYGVYSARDVLTALHLLVVLGHVVWSDGAQELDVVVAVELGHLLLRCLVRTL